MVACFAISFMAKAQVFVIDDFEGAEKGWASIADATVLVDVNPSGSGHALKVTCSKVGAPYSSFSGPILNGQTIPLGTGAGQYQYIHAKVYYEAAQTCVIKLENGPGGALFESGWIDVNDVNVWKDLVVDVTTISGFTPGDYGTFFMMPGRTNSEDWYNPKKESQIFYIDNIELSNDPNPTTSITDVTASSTLNVATNGNLVSISFDAQESSVATVSIFNVAGQMMNQQVLTTAVGVNQTTATITAKGIYIVKVEMGNKSFVLKFVK